jgi:hypothetical protein
LEEGIPVLEVVVGAKEGWEGEEEEEREDQVKVKRVGVMAFVVVEVRGDQVKVERVDLMAFVVVEGRGDQVNVGQDVGVVA